MSRNLCTSKCCGNIVRLSDLRGKSIEFRRHGSYPPKIGTRWDCPTCGTAYFVIWWNAVYDYRSIASGFVLDLAYYESYNDEHDDPIDLENPRFVCLDNAEDVQDVW
jgi:hypothetical protein